MLHDKYHGTHYIEEVMRKAHQCADRITKGTWTVSAGHGRARGPRRAPAGVIQIRRSSVFGLTHYLDSEMLNGKVDFGYDPCSA